MDLKVNLYETCDRYFFPKKASRAKSIVYWILKHPHLVIEETISQEKRFHLSGDSKDFNRLPTVSFIQYLCYILSDEEEDQNLEYDNITSRLVASGSPVGMFVK